MSPNFSFLISAVILQKKVSKSIASWVNTVQRTRTLCK